MTSLGILSRLSVFTLVVASAGCSDSITQVAAPQPTIGENAPIVSNAGAKPPTLVMELHVGDNGIFAGTSFSPPSDRLLYRVDVKGDGFPVGTPEVTRIMAIGMSGERVNPGSSGGPTSLGYIRSTFGATCPSRYVEMYAVVVSAAGTTESNHVTMGC
jgi:hypothetical protein